MGNKPPSQVTFVIERTQLRPPSDLQLDRGCVRQNRPQPQKVFNPLALMLRNILQAYSPAFGGSFFI
jgi:hypothetical protein